MMLEKRRKCLLQVHTSLQFMLCDGGGVVYIAKKLWLL